MTTFACDSSSLVSLSETCLIDCIAFLKGKGGARFIVPPEVRREIVSRPLHILRYEFSAIRLNHLLESGAVQVRNDAAIGKAARRLLGLANNSVLVGPKPVTLIQAGEAECLALVVMKQADALLIDEKTTRLLVEDAEKLRERMEGEYDDPVRINDRALAGFLKETRGMPIIRSSELLAVAAEKGFLDQYGPLKGGALQSALFSLRGNGCSLTDGELREYSEVRV